MQEIKWNFVNRAFALYNGIVPQIPLLTGGGFGLRGGGGGSWGEPPGIEKIYR